MANLALIKGFT